MRYDLIIKNGTVIDGTGMPGHLADVAIKDGLIFAIGKISESSDRVIDAEGHIVTPGFIDGHTHMDAQVFWDHEGAPSCYHGITTAVMGHCGFSLAPASAEERAFVVRNLERAEDISAEALAQGLTWTWSSFGEYLDAVDNVPKGINYAANVGHSALRTSVMGERAFEEEASPDDLLKMKALLAASLREGAVGFTTSRSVAHETSDDRPVASRVGRWDEVVALVDTVAEVGNRTFQLAPDAAVYDDFATQDSEELRALGELAVRARGVTVLIPAPPRPSGLRALALCDAVAPRGGQMVGLTHSRGLSILLSFKTRLPFDDLQEWKEVRSRPHSVQKVMLRDEVVRERLISAAESQGYGGTKGAEARYPNYDLITVLERSLPPNPTVAQYAARSGRRPVELMIDLALESDFEQFFVQPVGQFEDTNLLAAMRHPRTAMTFSDSGAHVSQIADCSIQTHLLGYWVREREAFTIEEAIRMLTSAPASIWRIPKRGLLREGFVADLNVINPASVAPNLPTVVSDLPAGANRIMQTASGFLATIVRGEQTIEHGNPTGILPGSLLRRGTGKIH